MGGLVSLSAINQKPSLFKSCVFVGVPFHSAPIILWALNRGAPSFFNPDFFGSLPHFKYKSSFVFLPLDQNNVIFDQNGQSISIDFWNPIS